MTIVRSIVVDNNNTAKKVAEDLQAEICKIEDEEIAHFISFVSVGSGTRIKPNPKGPWDTEISTLVFMAAFSQSSL